MKDDEWNVRAVAVEKLTDQALLEKIAVEDEDSLVRTLAEMRSTQLRFSRD